MSYDNATNLKEFRLLINEYLADKEDYEAGRTTVSPVGPLMTAEVMLEVVEICMDMKARVA